MAMTKWPTKQEGLFYCFSFYNNVFSNFWSISYSQHLVVVVFICIHKNYGSKWPMLVCLPEYVVWMGHRSYFTHSLFYCLVGGKSVELNSQIRRYCHINSVTWKGSLNHAWHFNLSSLVTSAGDISDEMEKHWNAPCG